MSEQQGAAPATARDCAELALASVAEHGVYGTHAVDDAAALIDAYAERVAAARVAPLASALRRIWPALVEAEGELSLHFHRGYSSWEDGTNARDDTRGLLGELRELANAFGLTDEAKRALLADGNRWRAVTSDVRAALAALPAAADAREVNRG